MNAILQNYLFLETKALNTTANQSSIAHVVNKPFILQRSVVEVDQAILIRVKYNRTSEHPVVQLEHPGRHRLEAEQSLLPECVSDLHVLAM